MFTQSKTTPILYFVVCFEENLLVINRAIDINKAVPYVTTIPALGFFNDNVDDFIAERRSNYFFNNT